MATLRERILDYLRSHPVTADADDDQLAVVFGVRRQAINRECRTLAGAGAIVRYHDARRHKLVSRIPEPGERVVRAEAPEPRDPAEPLRVRLGPFMILGNADAARAFAYPGETLLSEDSVKAAMKQALERDGWSARVQYGHLHGIDLEASRGSERLVLKVKGEGSGSQERDNYFLAALGQLLQRMDSPAAQYGLAFPAHRQFVGLITRLPDWVCQRLGLTFYLVRPTREGLEIGLIPPPRPPSDGEVN